MDLPEGTVTFLFSDVEGSTQLLERHPHVMGDALARHHDLFADAVAAHHGVIFETVGDAVYAAFPSASDGVAAAQQAQLALASEDWGAVERIACRIAVHTGEVERRGSHYFGPPLFRCARLQAIGYGEQTLLSEATAAAVRDRLPERATLRDLGQHRLKDLGHPEHVFMLLHPELRSTFPPPKSVDLRPNNLPLQLSSFVGREAETDAVASLVAEHRLVTLTGPGGVGKTRLALQVGGQLISDLPDGAFLVDLAAARLAEQLGPTAATALGVALAPGAAALDMLGEFAASRHLLLVIDNVEQIPDVAAPLLQLLGRAPELRLLVTSRTPLHVRGEQVHEVEPLDAASAPGTLPAAVQLFVDRATAVGRFALTDETASIVGEICRRLDGIPLAIELAAARTSIFEPGELLSRLDHRLGLLTGGARDLPERQRTLRAAIAWSYDLLDAAERAAFVRLAVFRGGWTLAAGEAVAGVGPDLLERLHDAGLVRRDGGRFRLLETIREFAAEGLADLEDARATALGHAVWYADWVESFADAEPMQHMLYPHELATLSAERENVAAAMEGLLEAGDGPRARRMALRLWNFWLSSGYIGRGEEWIGRAVELPPPASAREASWLTAVAGEYPRFGGEPERAIPIKERALEIARATGEDRSAAATLHDLASIWVRLGDFDRARSFAEEALEIRRRLGLGPGMAHALYGLGELEMRAGNHERARKLFHEAAEQGDERDAPFALIGLADASRRLGEVLNAAGYLKAAIESCMGWDHPMVTGDIFEYAGALLADCDRCSAATTMLGARERVRLDTGVAIYDPDVNAATRARVQAALAAPDFEASLHHGRSMQTDEALRFALEHCSALLADASATPNDPRPTLFE